MHVTKNWALIALSAALVVFLLGGGVALAADPPQPQIVSVTVTPEQDGVVAVSALFATSGGQAVTGEKVGFFLQSDFMGQSQAAKALLGNATTDDAGAAQVRYSPTWDGPQSVVVRLLGSAEYAPAEATATFDVAGSRGIHLSEHSVLAQVREWTPVIVGSVVMAFWTVMAMVLLRSAQGIMAAGHRKGMAPQSSPLRVSARTSRLQRR